MAEEKTSKKTVSNSKKNNAVPAKPAKSPRYEVKPEFWDDLFDALPPWIDEITAIVLLVFGVISFMALFDVSQDATLSKAWSDTLKSLFGKGSIIVASGIFVMGILILLPKLGVVIHFSTQRVLALEVAFLSSLALLHLSAGDTELRALARAGEGGGSVGWGVSIIPYWILGSTPTMFIFVILLFVSLCVVAGIRRSQINLWLEKHSNQLQSFGTRLESATQPSSNSEASVLNFNKGSSHSDLEHTMGRSILVVRIRPDWDKLPPSLRPGTGFASANASQSGGGHFLANDQALESDSVFVPPTPKDEVDQRLETLLMNKSQKMATDTVARPAELDPIGTKLPQKSKNALLMVERPDGRVKRYFTVEGLKEQKKVGRRDSSLPPLDILQDLEMNPPDEHEINHNVVLIENTLLEFDISVDVVDVKVGPTVTQYAVQPFKEVTNAEGETVKERTRLSKIAALQNDLALSLSARRLRLETPVPGHSYMGVEVPNKNPSIVTLRSVYESRDFYDKSQKASSPLLIPLGRDVAGSPVIIDIAAQPHLLIAGTTGSGKSVSIAAMATALILNNTPDTIKMIMLDPKMVELSRFNGLPHLLGPVETDLERIIGVLKWCTREMDRRYKLLEENDARNIQIFNSRLGPRRKAEQLPYIVILVDEVGDLMMSKPEETEKTITRLAQMARAVGMHLVVATQRPSVDVITGLIKANFPGRISFAVATGIDSRVILDSTGAETLLGNGDMLYLASDAAGPRRLQGCYVSDSEVRDIVQHWKDWKEKQKTAVKEIYTGVAPWERGLTRREFLSETDPMLEDAIELVVQDQEASASMIQRKLGLGYPRAARIIDLMEELGIIGESVDGGRTRKVLIERGKDPFQELIDRRTKK